MRRPAIVIGLCALSCFLGVLPVTAASSFTFTTFDVPLFGGAETLASGINVFGQVVGGSFDATFSEVLSHGYLRAPDGSLTLIDVPGAPGTNAQDINTIGVIVGSYRNFPGPGGRHCFMRNFGFFTTIDVPFPGASNTACRGINDQGQIVGVYITFNPFHRHGFLLSEGTFSTIDFPAPGVIGTIARRINDSGQIVGRYVDSSNVSHGFLLDQGVFTTIDFPGAKETGTGGINDNGQIVGTYRDANDNIFGFIKIEDTFTQIVLPGPVQNVGSVSNFIDTLDLISFLEGINDQGQIVGEFVGSDGRNHGFIGTPTGQDQQ